MSLVSEDMLRTSSSWKPKKVRHKGGISSWCKRLRRSQIYTGIGNAIYVQGTTKLKHGGQYLVIPEECQSLMIVGLICKGTCTSNYHTITTTTAPHIVTWKHEQPRLFKTRVALSLIECPVHVININVLLTINTNTKQ